MIRWSTILTPNNSPAVFCEAVKDLSALDGIRLPDGWLCTSITLSTFFITAIRNNSLGKSWMLFSVPIFNNSIKSMVLFVCNPTIHKYSCLALIFPWRIKMRRMIGYRSLRFRICIFCSFVGLTCMLANKTISDSQPK